MSLNYHVSILKNEILSYLKLNEKHENSVFIDATLGDGGHTLDIAQALNGAGKIISIDKDIEAINRSKNRLKDFNNIIYVNDKYENLEQILLSLEIDKISGILFDLGISSYQIDSSGRGFSFSRTEPLDMRMDIESGTSAKEIVNLYSEVELADWIWKFGEEKWSRAIAREIVKERKDYAIENTTQLVEIIKKAIPVRFYPKHHHVATKTFQALRIVVNQELIQLENTLKTAIEFLEIGGRICVISFHSLEDRIVKTTFNYYEGVCVCPPRLPVCGCNPKKFIRNLTSKPIQPTEEELAINPRSRSARLRVGEKIK